MTWKHIRLELAHTSKFPHGSAGRAYLLLLPLDAHDLIDDEELRMNPRQASVRRFWPSEADKNGCLISKLGRWVFAYAIGGEQREVVFHLKSDPIRLNNQVTVTETTGEDLPFKIVRCERAVR